MKERDFIHQHYGNRLRLRVCGVCIEGNKILMIRHAGLGQAGEMWLPPGGEAEWGSSLTENLEREFREETGLKVSVGKFLFVHEHLQAPLHAVEIFFEVRKTGGSLVKGTDPELPDQQQIIKEVRFLDFAEFKSIGKERLHACFRHCHHPKELNKIAGYFKFEK